ncbi:hypothetical protein [Leekyejoonella antrihumi]|uniref:DUF2029 domain-containing protein n=1 Tax=Leekyejoonella antrihumi TaxID=1660198 RepID=A0A563E6Z4_9MICO|nr:hypothetical protein [Leekyejoonella antrihumi]TWP38296.1 hypothetical protein FGL98_03550 [Leekyejoonella antrihumi]
MTDAPLRIRVPSQGDGVARLATEVIGGPTGRYAAVGRRGWAYAAAVLSALASVFVAVDVLQKNHCIRSGWGTPGSLWRECYSDLAVGTAGSPGSTPWSPGGAGATQPPLTAVLTWGLRHFVPSGTLLAQQQRYFAIGAVVIALLIGVTVIATASITRSTPWLAAHVALSPILLTASLVSFDIFGVALVTLGLAAWARRRPALAGALLGAGVMARSYPLIIIAAIILVAARDHRMRHVGALIGGALATMAVVLGLSYAVGGDPLAPYRVWNAAGASYGSPWLIAEIAQVAIPAHALTVIAILGWVIAVLVGLYLVNRPNVQTRLAPLALTMLVIVMITGKSMSVQSCLWVLPFVALTALRWREHLTWAGIEVVYFAMIWMYVALSSNPAKALPAAGYAIFCAIRLIAYIGLAWTSWETAEDLEDVLESGYRGPSAGEVPGRGGDSQDHLVIAD